MNNPLYFLPKDYAVLEENITDLQVRLKMTGLEAGEIVSQSSESWHDNYGFEEADRERKRLLKMLDDLQHIRIRAEVLRVKDDEKDQQRVSLGSRITVRNLEINEERSFLIGSYMVFEKTDPKEFSYASPFLSQLMGATIGEKRTVRIGEQEAMWQVVQISGLSSGN